MIDRRVCLECRKQVSPLWGVFVSIFSFWRHCEPVLFVRVFQSVQSQLLVFFFAFPESVYVCVCHYRVIGSYGKSVHASRVLADDVCSTTPTNPSIVLYVAIKNR
jgi:hypothetical protein